MINEVKSANKRARSMGKENPFVSEFNLHPLAACIRNHIDCLDVEQQKIDKDFLSMLIWIGSMARKINEYCDHNKIKEDAAAEYWLNLYAQNCDCVIPLDNIELEPIPQSPSTHRFHLTPECVPLNLTHGPKLGSYPSYHEALDGIRELMRDRKIAIDIYEDDHLIGTAYTSAFKHRDGPRKPWGIN